MLEKLPERIRKKITVQPNGCWLWVGAVGTHGYGVSYFEHNVQISYRIYTNFL